MKSILVVISCCLLLSCSYMSERKRHRHIIDSLSRVEVLKYFDTLVFFQRALDISGYRRDIPPVPFDIYDIIDLLQKEKVNILDSVYIGYRRDTKNQPYFWHVSVAYRKGNGEYSYMRHFDPQTGKVIKEKITRLTMHD